MRSPLPAMSAEERTRALEIANQARRERAELKRNMKAGRITPKTALDAKAAQRMRVEDFLASLPGIGKAKARKIMVAVGIAPNRRVRGLGRWQREWVVDAITHADGFRQNERGES